MKLSKTMVIALVGVVGIGAFLYWRNRNKKTATSTDPLAGSKLAQVGNRAKVSKSSLVSVISQQQGTIAPDAVQNDTKTLGNRT